jgi:hypothetical protein
MRESYIKAILNADSDADYERLTEESDAGLRDWWNKVKKPGQSIHQDKIARLKKWQETPEQCNQRVTQEMKQHIINEQKKQNEDNAGLNILERRAIEKFPSGGQRILKNIRNAE